ncbi:MAG: hypothetical protein RIT19_595 [Verrucomicrobiota bacterium]|jgi:uncharacterized protein (TIGR00255 family)
MKSMTGYGRGESSANGARVVVELKSVNRKQSEVVVLLPADWETLETRIRDSVARVVSRGRCEVRVTLEVADGGDAGHRINREAAQAYAREWSEVATQLGLTGAGAQVSLELLARCPGVLQSQTRVVDPESSWPAASAALATALESLDVMRRREGEALERDLQGRIDQIRSALERVRALAPEIVVRYRQQLAQRLQSAGLAGITLDDERILKELVVFADRSDISEEIARLGSHFQQYEDCRPSREAVGRKLDFLAQEFHREINTIGSKANDARIATEVVLMKTELERFREQVQNVE